jgi:translation elongation factor EF-1alpha
MLVKNISLLGHKDHGKSTLIGSMLMETGSATKIRIKEAEEYSKKLGKPFEPAFILDSFAEEREQEMTYDTTRAEIKYKDLAFAFIDVPGHEELIKNMISGASYGEIALLLVSAKEDEGIRDQTRRHLFISRMLGIERLIVAVNKMDLAGYDREKFERIRNGLSNYITRIGFPKTEVTFVPVSAYTGENLIKRSKKMGWYKGKTLLDTIYAYASKKSQGGVGALRIITQGTLPDKGGPLVVGKIISGGVRVGERVDILPSGNSATVKGITVKGSHVKRATVGENVALKLDKKINAELRGSVISSPGNKPIVTSSIKSRIFVTGPFGKDLRVKFNGVDIDCTRIKILHHISTVTGESDDSKTVKVLEAVEAEIWLSKKIPVEDYETTRELGRFVLNNGRVFAGIGIVIS